MFDDIAASYDLANTVMTLGLDQRWRRRTARAAIDGQRAATVLDCACGTGRLASAAVRAGALRVVGLDFSEQMIALARRRHPAIEFVLGDVLQLPFDDRQFSAVTIGFGLRNLPEPQAGLREMARVVRRGGRLAVLEAVRPAGPMQSMLDAAARFAPLVAGRLVENPTAYAYLSETVRSYATADALGEWMRSVGLAAVRGTSLGFGAVSLTVGVRPAS